ncbi:ninjurin-A-like [Zophobas morio]|uniref:ninjurin-A-like n=1 Tax=Zophobas morio TaxID=2755281 RepID=UPI003083E9D6
MRPDSEMSTKHVHNDENDNLSQRNEETSIAIELDIERKEMNNLTFTENKKDNKLHNELETQEQMQENGEDVVDTNIPTKQANSYAAKKTVAQGMMDIALITANANQLRYIIEFNRNSSTYYLNLCLIVISLVLQVGVGVSLIFKGKYDLKGESKHANAKRINNYVVVGIFLVTIINVFIASFTITGNSK